MEIVYGKTDKKSNLEKHLNRQNIILKSYLDLWIHNDNESA